MVFVFHAARPALEGGFIGVDVFFVLSGYLITLILVRRADAREEHQLATFYTRRIQRLVPASLLLLAAVAVRESLWGALAELRDRLEEIRAAVLYVANWNLIDRSDDYFAESAAPSPLRHLWSLAVEEQFYVVWAVLAVVVLRVVGARVLAALGAAFLVASMVAMAIRYTAANPAAAYYGTDARVFQPLVGALLAIWCAPPHAPSGSKAAAPVGVAALAALVAMAVRLRGTGPFYFHGGALLVAVSAAALIWALERSRRLAGAVGWSPLAALGRVSYGFYLWHWPIVVWVRPPFEADWFDRRAVNVVQFAATLALATASYVLVERPLRRMRFGRQRLLPFAGAAAAMTLVIASAAVMLEPPTRGRAAIAAGALADHSIFRCADHPRPCVRHEPVRPDAPTVALVGDSHAQHWYPAMMTLAEQYDFRFVDVTASGCAIGHRLLATGVDGELHKPTNFTCYEAIPGIYEELLERFDPDLVVATAWNERNRHVTGDVVVEPGTPEHRAETHDALLESVDLLTGEGGDLVFLALLPLGPPLTCLDQDPPNEGTCIRPIPLVQLGAEANEIFGTIDAERIAVRGVLDFTDAVCPLGACPLVVDGAVVRYDGQHFTGTESVRLAPLLDERLRSVGIDLGNL
jgi:peptidoglycan/LPS O-acetylase OafA/YrhL